MHDEVHHSAEEIVTHGRLKVLSVVKKTKVAKFKKSKLNFWHRYVFVLRPQLEGLKTVLESRQDSEMELDTIVMSPTLQRKESDKTAMGPDLFE